MTGPFLLKTQSPWDDCETQKYSRDGIFTGIFLAGFFSTLISWTVIEGKSTRETDAFHRQIADQTQSLIGEAKKRSGEIKIRGGVLVWDVERNSRSEEYDFPRTLCAKPSDRHVTVFMITRRNDVQVGVYSLGGKAYRQSLDVAVVYWPEKTPVGFATIQGAEPPRVTHSRGDFHGDTTEPFMKWIKSLPVISQE